MPVKVSGQPRIALGNAGSGFERAGQRQAPLRQRVAGGILGLGRRLPWKQRGPSLESDDSIHRQRARLLESLDCGFRPSSVQTVHRPAI